MDKNQADALEGRIDRDYGNTAGILVLQNGETEYERYFNGFTGDTATHVFSVTKSILSILIGIAMDQGLIHSLDQQVLSFFPDYTVKRGEKTLQRVTLQNLMTMTAPYKYKSAPYTRYFTSDSWVKASLDLLGGKGELGAFRYTPLIGPDILSGILSRVTESTVLDFAVKNLFSPLGIAVPENIRFDSKEEQLDIMKNRRAPGWVADPQGINTAGWGLFLTARDMARIGQLYLNGGAYGGRQIVSNTWVSESTAIHSHWNSIAYGLLWWIVDEQAQSFAALGDGGNIIYVNPAKKLVVAMASLFKPLAKDRVALIKTHIEPLFT